MDMSKLPTAETTTYGESIDKCISDFVIKTGTGAVVGGLFSLLFKRKRWPATLGAGIGMGMAYTACENRFRSRFNNNVQFQNTFNNEHLSAPIATNTDNIISNVGEKNSS